jgi:hypothetical protein
VCPVRVWARAGRPKGAIGTLGGRTLRPERRGGPYLLGNAADSGIGSCGVDDHNGRIDDEFAALPLKNLADAALETARTLGADHADFRVERVRGQRIALSDSRLQALSDGDDSGLAVRIIVDGTWGFASAVDLTPEAARDAARHAVEVAKVAAAMNTERIELAPEPGYGDVTWVSAYDIDPTSPPRRRRTCSPPGPPSSPRTPPSRTPTPACTRSRSASSTPTGPPRRLSSGSGCTR